jgi:O-antigen ligase
MRKDSAAISKLGEKDIRLIENGIANCRFHENPDLYQRLYETLWEIQIFHKTGYVQQHSLGQRLAFMKIATSVIRNHPWTGVGTGDVYDAMVASARVSDWNVDPKWEGKPHSQYFFYLLAFGILGFLWIMFSLVYGAILSRSYRHLLFNIYAGIILLSMLTLDTMESYDSVVFFSFFFSLFALQAFSTYIGKYA